MGIVNAELVNKLGNLLSRVFAKGNRDQIVLSSNKNGLNQLKKFVTDRNATKRMQSLWNTFWFVQFLFRSRWENSVTFVSLGSLNFLIKNRLTSLNTDETDAAIVVREKYLKEQQTSRFPEQKQITFEIASYRSNSVSLPSSSSLNFSTNLSLSIACLR